MHKISKTGFLAIAVHVLVACCVGRAETGPAMVTIEISEEANAADGLVRLADIARVSGGDRTTREAIMELDLAEGPQGDEIEEISQSQLTLRLLLAGIPRQRFQLRGADSVIVRARATTIDDATVLESVQSQLAEHMGMDPDDLSVRLMQPLVIPSAERSWRDGQLELDAIVPPQVRTGNLRLKLRVLVDGVLVHVLPVSLEVRIVRTVPIAKTTISAGQVISESNVTLDRRPVVDLRVAEAKHALGKRTRVAIRLGEAVHTRDLVDATEDAYLVQPHDVVRMVARKGKLTVTVSSGEVLQRARLGESVRVRNSDSRKIVVGRVKSPTEVEIVF